MEKKKAERYPYIDCDAFDFDRGSFELGLSYMHDGITRAITRIHAQQADIQASPDTFQPPWASGSLPLVDISYMTEDGQQRFLTQRVPIAGIGCNSAPQKLADKIAGQWEKTTGESNTEITIPVLQGRIDGHVIAHSAFVSKTGGVPATLYPAGAQASLTVGFYTPDEACVLTGTEPNYEGILLNTGIDLPNGQNLMQVLAYVSIWGALSADGQCPLVTSHIPVNGDFQTLTTAEAIDLVRDKTQPGMSRHEFISTMQGDGDAKLAQRLAATDILQRDWNLPPTISGRPVFEADIARKSQRAAAIAPKMTYT